jgi:hypothetical protein
MDTETESCKHLENQIVVSELTHGFRDNAFMKSSNGTLGGGDLCSVLIYKRQCIREFERFRFTQESEIHY